MQCMNYRLIRERDSALAALGEADSQAGKRPAEDQLEAPGKKVCIVT